LSFCLNAFLNWDINYKTFNLSIENNAEFVVKKKEKSYEEIFAGKNLQLKK